MRQASRLALAAMILLLSLTWTLKGKQIRAGIEHERGSVVSTIVAELRAVGESNPGSEPVLLLLWGALMVILGGKLSLLRSSRLHTHFQPMKKAKAIATRSKQTISIQAGDNVLDGSAKLPVCAE